MPDPTQPAASDKPAPTEEVAPPKKKKKHRLLKVIGVLILLLVLLVVFLPTILSLGAVRSLIASQAANYINGTVEIQSWSFGWFSPIKVSGVKVYDDQKRQVLEVVNFETQATLLKLARQNFDFGATKADVDATKVVIYHDGTTNLDKLLKQPAKSETPHPQKTHPGEPVQVPNVKIDLTLALRGGFEVVDDHGKTTVVQLRQGSGGTLKIDDINQGIALDQKLVYDVDNRNTETPSVITASGTADAFENNRLEIAKLSAAMKLGLAHVDIGAVQPFLAMAGQGDIKAAGYADGDLVANLQPGQAGGVNGKLKVTKVALTLPQLEDPYAADVIDVPIDISRAIVDGKSRLKIDIRLVPPEANVLLQGELPEDGLANLAKNQMPGYDGWLTLTVAAKPDQLAAKFPKTLQVPADVKVDGGDIVSTVKVTLAPQAIFAETATKLSAKGTRDGKPISIEPIAINTNTTVTSIASTPQIVAGLRALSFSLNSGFANANIGGKSVTQLAGSGDANLDKLLAEVRQFSDLSGIDLAGTTKFTLSSEEAKATPGDFGITFDAAINNLKVAMPKMAPINLAYATANIKSNLALDMAKYELKQVKDVAATVKAGDSNSKLFLDLLATLSEVDIAKMSASFVLDHLSVRELSATQKKLLDPFIPALKANGIELADGSIDIKGAGRFEMPSNTSIDVYSGIKPQKFHFEKMDIGTPGLRVRKDGKDLVNDNFAINLQGDVAMLGAGSVSATLGQLSIKSGLVSLDKTEAPFTIDLVNSVPRGSGALNVSADLVRLTQIARAMGAPPAAGTPAPKNLTSGKLTGKLNLASEPQKNSTVVFDGKLAKLSIEQTPVQNEDVAISLNAAVPSDPAKMTTADANATIKGQSFSVDAQKLAINIPGENTPVFKIVRNGHVEIALPDTAKAYAIAAALVPGLSLPFEPSAGSASVTLDVKNDGASIDGNVTGTRLALKNDKGKTYAFDPKKRITLNFGADLTAGKTLEKVTVRSLNGDLDVVTLAMPKDNQIVINDPMGNPSPKGQIELAGAIEHVTPLLQFIQEADAPLPYRGNFKFVQTVSSDKGVTQLVGNGTVENFVVPGQAGQPAFTEKLVKITNDLSVDQAKKFATIKSLAVEMSSSQAATVHVTGGIEDWEKQRLLKDIAIAVNASGEKAWPLLYPMLSPDLQAKLKDAKITGPTTINLTVRGAYPANLPMEQAIAMIDGAGAIDLSSFQAMGFEGSPERLPLTLQKGKLYTADLKKKGAERFGKPWPLNGGTLNLGSMFVDLTKTPMTLSVGRGNLIENVKVNPIMANAVGASASLLFKDVKDVEGLLTVSIAEFNEVPMGEMINGKGRARAQIGYALKNLRLQGGLVQFLDMFLQLGDQGLRGDIKEGRITLRDGILDTDCPVLITGEHGVSTLSIAGKLEMANDFKADNYFLSIPLELIKNKDIQKFAPAGGLKIPIKGTMTTGYKPDFNLQDMAKDNIPGVVGGLLKGAVEGNNKKEKRNR